MKLNKSKIKFIIVLIVVQILISANIHIIHAANGFSVGPSGELTCNAGEEIDVPIVIDNIEMSSTIQRGVVSFSLVLDIPENIFEIVETSGNYISVCDDIRPYVSRCVYIPESQKLMMVIDMKDDDENELCINEYTKLADITLKAKAGTKTGRYSVGAVNVEGGNTEQNIDADGKFCTIYVNGVNVSDEEEPELSSDTHNIGTTRSIEGKQLDVSYVKSNDNKKLYVYVDEVNGVEVGKVVIDGCELTKTDNCYEANVEPGKTYKIVFYDKNGNLIAVKIESMDNINDENEASKSSNGYKYGTYKPSNEDKSDENAESKSKGIVEKILTGDGVMQWIMLASILSVNVLAMIFVRKRIYRR